MTTETIPTSPLEAALLSIINNTTQAVGKGVDFLAEQIPDVIHQLLMWKAVESFIWFVCPLVVATITLVVAYFIEKALKQDNDILNRGMAWFACGLISILCFVISIYHMDWLQIWIAPKVWLIEYAARLVKGH